MDRTRIQNLIINLKYKYITNLTYELEDLELNILEE